MISKTVLITGASSGIGEASARRLLADGHVVYAAARRLERMQRLADAGARLLSLDLTEDTSIVAAVEAIRQARGCLDVLVNNAGYGSYGALEDVPLEEGRRQFEVNLFGLVRLIQLSTPMMRAQGSGTIVNITSIGGRMHEPLGAWYHATKFAVEGLSDCLRMELAPFGIHVVVIEPGAIRTEWSGIAQHSLLQYSSHTAYAAQAKSHARMLAASDTSKLSSSPEVVARTIARAVRARRPRTRYPTGGGARTILFLRWILADRTFDAMMRIAEKRLG
ncbi:MAG: SDR family NAD(P)-dependent oxidoreductase [Rhodanobacter sp.]|nr:MAG: SDR family NAD(P)-dependent oxidoreductase [Rhodanobacter sp.]TAL92634.1 MAG: SDR family NAD(P)-dependent oxidoreductase [Rhodanobacter sp.]TAM38392.1 MAG: SDR family NAD(P)-dependent oxidoreductase [Rhodanobacter sp.]TAN27879.1 MAG: SDR family NAD(P)-dependent oxidoreductase [Rhodanobacter sp.]